MTRKLLTSNQTDLVKAIRSEIKSIIGRDVTITDVLNSISNKYMIDSIALRIKKFVENVDKEQELSSRRKEYNVYRGEVLSNGIRYKAIVATKNKTELQSILIIDEREAKKWIKSDCPSHLDIAIKYPGTFFGSMLTVRGRPSIGQYVKLTNVKPLKGIM